MKDPVTVPLATILWTLDRLTEMGLEGSAHFVKLEQAAKQIRWEAVAEPLEDVRTYSGPTDRIISNLEISDMHEYTITMKCDQSPTGRAGLCIIRSPSQLTALPINYDSETISTFDMQCTSDSGQSIPILPSDGPVTSIGADIQMPDPTTH